MITPQVSMRVSCDQNHYDSAAITVGILMANAGSGHCRVELGPFSSFESAVASARAAGWLVVERPAYASGETLQLCYCPVHREQASEFWQKVTEREVHGNERNAARGGGHGGHPGDDARASAAR